MQQSWLRRLLTTPLGLVGFSALLVGIILLPFGIVSQVHDQQFRDRADSTQTVTLTQKQDARDQGTTITFTYRVQGRAYTARQSGPDYKETLANPQKVLYDPANPSHAILANGNLTNESMAFSLAIFFLLLGVVLLLLRGIWRILHRRTAYTKGS